MNKKICFFSGGFAFNRLNRMRFYEKALPEDTGIFLFTTDRWHGKGKEAYQFEWSGLKRTKIITAKYNWTLPLQLRKFCKQNKINRIINIGNRGSMTLFLLATFFTKTDYIFNLMGWVPKESEMIKNLNSREIKDFFFFYFFAIFAKKITSNDYGVYKWFTGKNKPLFFKLFSKNISYLPPPVDTDVFYSKNKKAARKKIGIPQNKKVIIFVGRVKHRKGSDVLIELIKRNKEILFIVIGKVEDKKFEKIRESQKNIFFFEKINPEDLLDYYNSADIAFLFQRIRGAGLGQTAHEALACGLPTFAPCVEVKEKTPILYQIPPNGWLNGDFIYDLQYATNEADKIIKNYFKKSKKEREKISKIAREYALKNYSNKVWAKPHTREYLW